MSGPFTSEELTVAWERVAENEGCAGVDRETIAQFAARLETRLGALAARLSAGAWMPLPLLKILVEKKPGGRKQRRR